VNCDVARDIPRMVNSPLSTRALIYSLAGGRHDPVSIVSPDSFAVEGGATP